MSAAVHMPTSAESLALDFSNAAMEPPALADAYRPNVPMDPWLARRTRAWGGSEVGPLLVAYGLAPLDAILPGWVLEQSEHYARLGVPKILAWKSGLRARPAGDTKTKDAGNTLERELLARYKATIASCRVDPKTIRHADTLPRQFYPFFDGDCAHLAVTPDAWAKAHDGELAMIELKTSVKDLVVVRMPWHYRCQLQAEMAVCAARWGLLVIGERWIQPDGYSLERSRGPIRAFATARDESMIHLVRTVATEAWSVVEQLRNLALEVDALGDAQTAAARRTRKAAAAKCAELWIESRARMQAHADPSRAHLEHALSEIEGLDEILARQSA